MPSTPGDGLIALLHRLRPRILGSLEAYQARTGHLRGLGADQALEECLGALWLELVQRRDPEQEWRQALRRVLYQECERAARRRTQALRQEPPAARPAADQPPLVQAWLEQVQALLPVRASGQEPGLRRGAAARSLGLSRTALRWRLTFLALELSDGHLLQDITRRAARVLARAAAEGPRSELALEARRILHLASLLEPPPALRQLRPALRALAGSRATPQ